MILRKYIVRGQEGEIYSRHFTLRGAREMNKILGNSPQHIQKYDRKSRKFKYVPEVR